MRLQNIRTPRSGYLAGRKNRFIDIRMIGFIFCLIDGLESETRVPGYSKLESESRQQYGMVV